MGRASLSPNPCPVGHPWQMHFAFPFLGFGSVATFNLFPFFIHALGHGDQLQVDAGSRLTPTLPNLMFTEEAWH